MPPALVSSRGYTLEMRDQGAGKVTAVLENGFGETLDSWNAVQQELSQQARVITYNRAGIGRSQSAPTPRTADNIASDLHAALIELGAKPPYVLVSHSAGALYARVFAHTYAPDIGGLVFVDAPNKTFYDWLQTSRSDLWNQLLEAARGFPPGLRQESAAVLESAAQAEHAWPLPHVPIEVIISTKPQPPFLTGDVFNVFRAAQEQFAEKTRAHVTHSECGHNLPVEDPGAIVAAVRRAARL